MMRAWLHFVRRLSVLYLSTATLAAVAFLIAATTFAWHLGKDVNLYLPIAALIIGAVALVAAKREIRHVFGVSREPC